MGKEVTTPIRQVMDELVHDLRLLSTTHLEEVIALSHVSRSRVFALRSKGWEEIGTSVRFIDKLQIGLYHFKFLQKSNSPAVKIGIESLRGIPLQQQEDMDVSRCLATSNT